MRPFWWPTSTCPSISTAIAETDYLARRRPELYGGVCWQAAEK